MRPHSTFLVYISAFSNKIMSMILIVSILIIFGHSDAYGQTMGSTDAGNSSGSDNDDRSNNTTRTDIIDCLVNTCINPNFQLPSNTSVIAMAFVNLTLKDIQDYKEVLKSDISQHINDTIDSLATGRGFDFSICDTSQYRSELPCPLINGIVIPPTPPSPQNLTTVK
jgi:hypothetical protein